MGEGEGITCEQREQTLGQVVHDEIVDAEGLAQILKTTKRRLQGVWRSYPHFFVGEGQDLRTVRFDVDDVLAHLKRGGNYDCVARKGDAQRRRARGGFQANRDWRNANRDPDPFNLLSGIGNRVSRRLPSKDAT